MGMLARMAVAPRIKADAGVPTSAFEAGFGPMAAVRSAASVYVSQSTAMSAAAFYAGVTRRTQDFARCVPRLFRERKGTPEQVTQHDLVELFKKPNRAQSWFEFAEQVWAGRIMRGNGIAPQKRGKRYQVSELIPVNPDAVQVLEGSEGGVYYLVNRVGLWQMAMLREFPTQIPAEDVFHVRGLSFNALVGASTIGMARDTIGVDLGLQQQQARWLANGARPSVFLQTKKTISPESAKRLKASFESVGSGLQNTGNTIVLEDGLEANALQLTSVDLQLIEQRKISALDICHYVGVHPFKIGIGDLRGVDLEAVDQQYVNSTIAPDLDRFEARLDFTFDLRRQGLFTLFDETVLLRGDSKTRYNNYRIALLTGFKTYDEVRALEGDPPYPNGAGAKPLRPLNMAALGSDVSGTAPDGAGRPAAGSAPPAIPAPGKAARRKESGKTLYISRALLNADDLIAWAKSQGFETTLAAADMHVTIAFSRDPVDWSAIGVATNSVLVAEGTKGRSVEQLGDKGAIVLRFKSTALEQRWAELCDLGAAWDWPSYKPHVTITYDGAAVDLDAIEPYAGELIFGPERFAEVDEGWTDKIAEKGRLRIVPGPEDAHTFLRETLAGRDGRAA